MGEPKHWCIYCRDANEHGGRCDRHDYEKETAKPEPKPELDDPDKALAESEEQLLRVQAERFAQKTLHEWRMAKAREPQLQEEQKAQLAEDRRTFSEAARLFSLSNCEANLILVREILGAGFTAQQVGHLKSGSILAPASPEELERWRQEAAEQRQNYLVNHATPQELRQAARDESEQRRVQAANEEAERQIQHRKQLDEQHGFPVLPESDQYGTPLNSQFFKKLSNTDIGKFRNFIRRYGAYQITDAVRNRI